MNEPPLYDFLIIGAGVVGCALAHELSRFDVRVGVIEQNADVGDGVSKANSSIVHTGFDAKPGSLEARLVAAGSRLWHTKAGELGVPLAAIGAVMLALDDEQANRLDGWLNNARQNGITDVQILSREQVLTRVPHVNPKVQRGLWVPRESVTDTFSAVIALAEHAAMNGVKFHLEQRVTQIERREKIFQVHTAHDIFATRWIVNSAGLWGDDIAALMGQNHFTIAPRKGEFLILDKSAREKIPHIILPVPTPISKGILITPTMNGNVLLGPTADDVSDKHDVSVSADGLARVRQGASKLAPSLADEPVVATYAGLRPVGSSNDYIIEVNANNCIVTTAGIRSTGLSSALAIAREVSDRLTEAGVRLRERDQKNFARPARAWIPGAARPCFDDARLRANPAFGRIICHCETVSEGEIVETLHAPIPAATLDAIKKRTWATAGRCQGFYCTAVILELMSRELHRPITALTKRVAGSTLVGPELNHTIT